MADLMVTWLTGGSHQLLVLAPLLALVVASLHLGVVVALLQALVVALLLVWVGTPPVVALLLV